MGVNRPLTPATWRASLSPTPSCNPSCRGVRRRAGVATSSCYPGPAVGTPRGPCGRLRGHEAPSPTHAACSMRICPRQTGAAGRNAAATMASGKFPSTCRSVARNCVAAPPPTESSSSIVCSRSSPATSVGASRRHATRPGSRGRAAGRHCIGQGRALADNLSWARSRPVPSPSSRACPPCRPRSRPDVARETQPSALTVQGSEIRRGRVLPLSRVIGRGSRDGCDPVVGLAARPPSWPSLPVSSHSETIGR